MDDPPASTDPKPQPPSPIGLIQTKESFSGGGAYHHQLRQVLERKWPVRVVEARPTYAKLRRPQIFYHLMGLRGSQQLWIRDWVSAMTLPFDATAGKQVVVFHHQDRVVEAHPWFERLLEGWFDRLLSRIDVLVTVSRFWQERLSQHHEDVRLIHNGFDLEAYECPPERVAEFRRRHRLGTRPLIYLGSCWEAKGCLVAAKALAGMEVDLVVSGSCRGAAGTSKLPLRRLKLDFTAYVALLHAADVAVTLSLFDEGWCRTAHEALLCGTPVVGSGRGGMGELLTGAGQWSCRFPESLPRLVAEAMVDKEGGERGRRFARQFDMPRFEGAWLTLVEELLEGTNG